jgi:hypothetical protein
MNAGDADFLLLPIEGEHQNPPWRIGRLIQGSQVLA